MNAAPAASAAASDASGSFSRISTPTAIDVDARTSSRAITAIAAIVSRPASTRWGLSCSFSTSTPARPPRSNTSRSASACSISAGIPGEAG